MDSLQFNQFPLPSLEHSGWPWFVNSEQIAPSFYAEKDWPKISIVTPSFNQGQFLEETIRSVLLQGYPNLEYIIIDGGSTDESVAIIKKYEPWLTYWSSEPDRGQTHALNKGFDRISGDWLAWINSDDYYQPGAFFRLACAAEDNPGVEWIVGSTVIVDSLYREQNLLVPRYPGGGWTNFVCVRQSGIDLPQPSSFWSRAAWLATGRLNETFHYAMDHEYWVRLARSGFYPLCLKEELAVFRRHEEAKTSEGVLPFWREEVRVIKHYLPEATPFENKALLDCKDFLEKGIKRIEREFMVSSIPLVLLKPLRWACHALNKFRQL